MRGLSREKASASKPSVSGVSLLSAECPAASTSTTSCVTVIPIASL
ncbi:hypothetical protein [Pseudonocardia humida]|uniref:Uncharacterized protein n=1 Tax=Pseudonocardia humida TaxID=2800819 RepID=A0ABT1AD45_9PSEU|nr:hypothetical protein [Pseudonocardia humida]MCO1660514.1 hypothetical protein [Pseudonocardia humida]